MLVEGQPIFMTTTDDSQSQSKHHKQAICLENLQTIDLKSYKKKLRLLFATLPTSKEISELHEELLHSKQTEEMPAKEQLLLQCYVLCLSPPADLNLDYNQWQFLSQQMPTSRSPSELEEVCSQWVNQSAYSYPWTEREDNILQDIVIKFKKIKKGNKWSRIAKEFNDISQAKYSRLPKQCRERWGNKLDPTINRSEWNDNEDLLFLQLLLQYGRKWAELSVRLSALTENKKRTEFALKHRYKKLVNNSPISSKRIAKPKLQVSNDWTQKQANQILQKIDELESIVGQAPKRQDFDDLEHSFTVQASAKQLKLDQVQYLVIIKGNSIQKVDLSYLLKESELF
ncbi:hypothetical protein pb186bvf_003950 [Paramecium bursaria]